MKSVALSFELYGVINDKEGICGVFIVRNGAVEEHLFLALQNDAEPVKRALFPNQFQRDLHRVRENLRRFPQDSKFYLILFSDTIRTKGLC